MDLSQDQTVLEELLHLRTAESFTAAEAVYRKGGHSKSIATVTLKTGLSGDIVKGTELYGIDKDERDVIGTAAMDYKKGDTVIEFVYPATKKDETPYDCHVGGLPEDKQERDGCKFFCCGALGWLSLLCCGFATQPSYLLICFDLS